MHSSLLHTLKILYFAKIALLPGLAVIGYFILTSGWKWLDATQGIQNVALGLPASNPLWSIFSATVMLFVSLLCFVILNLSRSPVSPVMLILTVLQLPLILLICHLIGLEDGFWRSTVTALLVEMNALLLAVISLKLFGTGNILPDTDADAAENTILVWYLITALLLLNFTTYGAIFWRDILALAAPRQMIILTVILLAAATYFRSFRNPDGASGEATRILGAETISGIVLVPTWGMLIFVYPLCPVIGMIIAGLNAAGR